MAKLDDLSVDLNEGAQNVALGLRRGALAPLWVTCVAACIDLPVFTLAFWFAQYSASPNAHFNPVAAGGWAGLSAVFLVSILIATKGYRAAIMADQTAFIARTVLAVIGPACALVTFAPAPNTGTALAALVICLGLAIFLTRLGAQIIAKWILEAGLIARRAVIAGGGDEAARLIRGLGKRQINDIRLFGIFDDRNDTRSPPQVMGIPKLGTYSDLISFVRASEIDLVIIALPHSAEERIKWLLDEFRVLPVEIGLSAFSKDFAFGQTSQAAFQARAKRRFAPECRLTKRIFDIFFAVCALALLWPILLIAAIAVRLESPGPVLFRQHRHGYNNRVIQVLKLRSMFAESADPQAKQIVTKNDPRVTRVGRFLRRSSIDELPQLFNVLRGDLSLVGPRPHAIEAVSSQHERFTQIVDGYSARHSLPPGITGWAQINGWRGEIDDAQKLVARFEHDLFYIENWSFWLDLKILLRTPLSLLSSKGAY